MGESSIAARMEDYFRRQVDLFSRMTEADASLPADVESPEWERVQKLQEGFSRELTALEEEFRLLKREWDVTADIAPAVREQMGEVATAVRAMAEGIARTRTEDAERIEEMVHETRRQWETLQRGKRMLRDLRAGERGDGGFIDRKA